MMTPDEAFAFYDAHGTRSAFRMEVATFFAVTSDGDDYHRYVAGEPDYDHDRKDPWLATLREEKSNGFVRSRVRVLTPPLNDYLRYEFEWGYLPNAAAGETIRVLDLSEVTRPDDLIEQDFWILDDAHVLVMIYNEAGEFVGGQAPTDVEPYGRARDSALAVAEDVNTWWNRHPQEHRANRVFTA